MTSGSEASLTSVIPRRVSSRFLRSELWLIFGRRRNWAGLAVLASVPILIAITIKISPPTVGASGRDSGPDFFTAITSNGIFVAIAALGLEIPLFLPLAVATIAADTIAGEANLGTLRYLLAVPVGRTRMLIVKYTAVVIFAFTAVLLVALVGTVLGLALFGGGNVTLLSGAQVPFGEGLLRLAGIWAYLAVCLCALGAIGLFVSSLTEQPIGGAIALMILTVGSFVLDTIPQLDWLHPYLLTHNWLAFGNLLSDPIGWDTGLRAGLLSAGAYILVFWTAAWANFSSRDVTA
jgi:ABC-2 type transport system permease protein